MLFSSKHILKNTALALGLFSLAAGTAAQAGQDSIQDVVHAIENAPGRALDINLVQEDAGTDFALFTNASNSNIGSLVFQKEMVNELHRLPVTKHASDVLAQSDKFVALSVNVINSEKVLDLVRHADLTKVAQVKFHTMWGSPLAIELPEGYSITGLDVDGLFDSSKFAYVAPANWDGQELDPDTSIVRVETPEGKLIHLEFIFDLGQQYGGSPGAVRGGVL